MCPGLGNWSGTSDDLTDMTIRTRLLPIGLAAGGALALVVGGVGVCARVDRRARARRRRVHPAHLRRAARLRRLADDRRADPDARDDPAVTPTVNPNWDVEKVMEELDEPIEAGHGEQITERVAEVVYTAKTPLPDGYRDAFVLSLQVPEDPAGETLYFPTIQTCEEGETAWIEIPEAGQDSEELEVPAPSIEVVAAAATAADDAAAAQTQPSRRPVTSSPTTTAATAASASPSPASSSASSAWASAAWLCCRRNGT